LGRNVAQIQSVAQWNRLIPNIRQQSLDFVFQIPGEGQQGEESSSELQMKIGRP